ncbi:MAG: citrate synthase [Deltaproteobacteria bacterium]|nr:citrate synthase [Deltaproteobacteria bacterium]
MPTQHKQFLTVVDNRTGKKYELPVEHRSIWAVDLKRIRVDENDRGLYSYDPAFLNTTSCKSSITFIDGEKGILLYRGYPIEELAQKKSYLEVAYLIIYGELPNREQFAEWEEEIKGHLRVNAAINHMMRALPRSSHPMPMLISAIAALSCLNPGARNVTDVEGRQLQIVRLIAKAPTLAAWALRHNRDLPPVEPDPEMSYTGNFLAMLFQEGNKKYKPHPVIEKALDVLFTLHADHEQNCSTTAMRVIGSSHADPFAAAAGAAAALFGPRHGGANEAVLKMLKKIGSKDKVAEHIRHVKDGEERLMGFGHRVYKNYDPRAKVIKDTATKVFEVTGINPLLDIALELERIALEDNYFIKRKLYPNVDFYSGLIYEAIGIPTEMFTVLFAVARVSGWLAQWREFLLDPEQKISRPRQIYLGRGLRHLIGIPFYGVMN